MDAAQHKRKGLLCSEISLSEGKDNDLRAVLVHFAITRGNLLRVTQEYNLIYVLETNEWFGDVIAYGQWWDLEPDEVMQLREAYELDALMQDYLEGDEQRISSTNYVEAKNS